MKISFSIMNSKNVVNEVKKAKASGINSIHIDHSDGKFIEKKIDSIKQLKKIKSFNIPLEVHIMNFNPSLKLIEKISSHLKKNRDRIMLHYESFEDKNTLKKLIKKINLDFSLVLSPETPLEVLKDFNINSVTLMSVIPGNTGNKFIEDTVEKVKKVKKYFPELKITLDGGINEISFKKIKNLNLDSFVSRTWFLKNGFKETINEINNYVLGISGSWHDSTAVLLKNGKLISALEEERMTRTKHDSSPFPFNSIYRILEKEKITLENIKHIAVGWDYNIYTNNSNEEFFKKMDIDYANNKNIPLNKIIRRNVPEKNKERFKIKNVQNFLKKLKFHYNTNYIPQISFISHHSSHAASAYYPSGFKEPTLTLVLDGYGDFEAGSIWIGENNKLKKLKSFKLPNSIGWMYIAVTEYLNFKPNSGEGQVMGFAPYGEPLEGEENRVNKLREIFEDYIHFDVEKEELIVNPENLYYGKMLKNRTRLTHSFVEKLKDLVPYRNKSCNDIDPFSKEDRPYANLAFVLQETTENIVFEITKHYLKKYNLKHLAFAGGIALNILSNGNLITKKLISPSNLFIQPAASDSGTALGAALTVSKNIYNEKVNFKMKHAFYGIEYSNKEIKKTLKQFGLIPFVDYKKVNNKILIREAANCIKNKEAIAWFQGKSEYGPRALGSRSILLNILDDAANNTANKIKGRQNWRPSASSFTQESAKYYFKNIETSPFMIVAFDLIDKDKIASGIHQYGKRLARPQTIDKSSNPLYWKLLSRVGKLTGIPAVVNTSFNKREPLVENPEEAINTFKYMKDVKKLFLGNYILEKKNISPTVISLVDEPILQTYLDKALKGDINDWNTLFEETLNQFHNCHKIKIKIDNRELTFPLFKELFEGDLNLQKIISSIIYNNALDSKTENIVINSTNKKMQLTIFTLLRDYIKNNFKRINYFANNGNKIRITQNKVIIKKIKESPSLIINEKRDNYIGIDVGGTRIKGVFVRNKEVKKIIVPTIRDSSLKLKNLIKAVIKKLSEDKKISGIGISLPGVVEKNKVKWLVNYEYEWKNKNYSPLNNLIDELKKEYNTPNVNYLNDATSFGICYLSKKEIDNGLVVVLGTGVGVSRVKKGKIDHEKIEQSGAMVIDVKDNALFDKGCSALGCFSAYLGIQNISKIIKNKNFYKKISKNLVSWIHLMHNIRKDNKFLITGGNTNLFSDELIKEINKRLHKNILVKIQPRERDCDGALGAAIYSMSLNKELICEIPEPL